MIIPKYLPKINTKRLLLTPLQIKHLKYTTKWRGTSRIISSSKDNTKFSYKIKDQITWFKDTRKNRIDYMIYYKLNMEPVGVWSLKKIKNRINYYKIMEQGRYIGSTNYLRKGIAKEVALEWLKFGFKYLCLDKIVSYHKKNNIVPQMINLKMGFEYNQNYNNRNFIKMEFNKKNYLNKFK